MADHDDTGSSSRWSRGRVADSLKAIQKNLLAIAGLDAQQWFRNLADFLSVELRLTACAPMATCLRCW
jgi:hypothetical protein